MSHRQSYGHPSLNHRCRLRSGPILNERVMIYDADNGIEYRHAVQIVPFAMVQTKSRAVGVRSINMQYASRRIAAFILPPS